MSHKFGSISGEDKELSHLFKPRLDGEQPSLVEGILAHGKGVELDEL